MKISTLLLLFLPSLILAQHSNTITVTGNANCEVMPDQATIAVAFSSYEKVEKSDFEELIRNFNIVLDKWAIDAVDVRLMDMSGMNYGYDFSKKIQMKKSYEIDLKNVKIIHQLIGDLFKTGAHSVYISKLEYNQLDSIQLNMTNKAMLNARKKASLMAQSQGHEIGNTISIRELGAETRESGDFSPKYGDYSYDYSSSYRSRMNATGAVSRAVSSDYDHSPSNLNSVYVGVSVKVIYELE